MPADQASAASSSGSRERVASAAVATQARVTGASSETIPATSLSRETDSTNTKRAPGQIRSSVSRSARAESGVWASSRIASPRRSRRAGQLERLECAELARRERAAEEHLARARGERQVRGLVRAEHAARELAAVVEAEAQAVLARAHVARGDLLERGVDRDRLRRERAPGLGRERAVQRGCAGAEDAGLLARDRLERLAQLVGVLELDRGDDRDARVDGVGRVEPAAEPDLDRSDLDPRGAEQVQRERGGGVEEARTQLRVGAQPLDRGPDLAQPGHELALSPPARRRSGSARASSRGAARCRCRRALPPRAADTRSRAWSCPSLSSRRRARREAPAPGCRSRRAARGSASGPGARSRTGSSSRG